MRVQRMFVGGGPREGCVVGLDGSRSLGTIREFRVTSTNKETNRREESMYLLKDALIYNGHLTLVYEFQHSKEVDN